MLSAKIDSRARGALQGFAETLLELEPGDELPPRYVLARDAGVGVGTLMRAIETLTEMGAVTLNSVQGAGTSVERIDYGALWRLCGGSILRGQLPMNLSVQMEAIEVAIGQAMTCGSLEAALVYREGATRRMRAVEAGVADFAVISSRALEHGPRLSVAHRFGPGSYYGSTQLYLLRRSDADQIRRVGVDELSPDHVTMVTGRFPRAEVVAAPFRLIPPMIIGGTLDATVWFGGTALPVDYVNLLRADPVELDDPDLLMSEAVIATLEGGAVDNLFKQLDSLVLNTTYRAVIEAGPSFDPLPGGARR